MNRSPRLTAATYLGDNTIEPMLRLVRAVTEEGVPVDVVDADQRTSARALGHGGTVDLLWMCGGLVAEQATTGELSHQVVAAPVFAGQTDAVYHSVIVGRSDRSSATDLTAGRVAINELASWSGHRALRRHLSPAWFADEMITGSHRASIDAVAAGTAECAAIDHTVWAHTPNDQLVIVDRTVDWPAPPLLIRCELPVQLRQRLTELVLQVTRTWSDPTVTRFVPATVSDYEVMA